MGRITTAEKIKRFRNKKNNDVAYNHSESKRVEKCRKAPVDKMPKSKKEEYKIKARKRQRKCRAEKKAKQENSNTSETACPIASSNPLPNINLNTKQSYRTAAARSKEALLTSPRKKLAVVAELAFRDKNVT